MKKERRTFKFINGTKGAVALFMAVLMTPFLTLSLSLVEIGRFNSAVSEIEEALGVTDMSLLADYDTFLQDRFGVYALKQKKTTEDYKKEAKDYMDKILDDGVTVNSIELFPKYSLSDLEILKMQIMEFSSLNAPTFLGTNFLNLSSIFKSFSGLKDFKNIIDIINKGGEAVDSGIDVAESIEDIKECVANIEKIKGELSSDYNKLTEAVDDLIEVKNEDYDAEDEDAVTKHNNAVSSATGKVNSAKSTYSSTIATLVANLDEYISAFSTIEKSIQKIENDAMGITVDIATNTEKQKEAQKDLEGIKETIKELKAEGKKEGDTTYDNAKDWEQVFSSKVAEYESTNAILKARQASSDAMTESWSDACTDYGTANLSDVKSKLSGIKSKVNGIDCATITDSLSDAEYYLDVYGYMSEDDLDKFEDEQVNKLKESGLKAFLDGINSFISSLSTVNLFFDMALTSNINDGYYTEEVGGLPSGKTESPALRMMADIGTILGFPTRLGIAVVTGHWLDILNLIKDFLNAFKDFGDNFVKYWVNFIESVKEAISAEKLYITTYSVFNNPCRTDYSDGTHKLEFTSFSGGTPSTQGTTPISEAPDWTSSMMYSLNNLGDAVVELLSGETTGDDYAFTACEMEYIMCGSSSEMQNQMSVFFQLYIFRLLLDLVPILVNPEVQAFAGSLNIAYPIAIILIALLEPLVDTVLLVNGDDIDFIKTDIFLTPAGIPDLITSLVSCINFSEDAKKNLKDEFITSFGGDAKKYQGKLDEKKKPESSSSGKSSSDFAEGLAKYAKGLQSFSYKEYCFLIMYLTVPKEEQLKRIANLIEMEGTFYNKYDGDKDAEFVFDLKNCYTYIEVEADCAIKQLLPSLIDSSHFKVKRKIARGY